MTEFPRPRRYAATVKHPQQASTTKTSFPHKNNDLALENQKIRGIWGRGLGNFFFLCAPPSPPCAWAWGAVRPCAAMVHGPARLLCRIGSRAANCAKNGY